MSKDILEEKKAREVVLNCDDVRNIRDFFNHFKIEIAPELETAMSAWETKKDKVTIEDQDALKVGLCISMIRSEHAMFRDDLFSNIIKNSEKIVFESTFQKELETQLTKKPE